jgi:hypothetical protein
VSESCTETPRNQAIPRRFKSFLESSTLLAHDEQGLKAVRVSLGIVLLADLIHQYAFLGLLPEVHGWRLAPTLVVWCVVLFCMVVGYKPRAAALGNYLFCVAVFGVFPEIGLQHATGDPIAITLSLLVMLMPLMAPDKTRWFMVGYLSLIYVDSAIYKLFSPMWSGGFGFTAPASLPVMVWTNSAWMAWLPPMSLRFVGWGVVAFELLFPLLYLWHRTRMPALLIGAAMHVGIAVMYPHLWFSGLMLVFYVALLPQAWRTRAEKDAVQWRRQILPGVVAFGVLTAFVYIPNFLSSGRTQFVLKTIRRGLSATIGLGAHKVFEDSGFTHYDYQLRLVQDGRVSGRAVPYARDGLYAWSIWDRVWEFWLKHTQSPFVPLPEAEINLARWAAFYWPNATVSIEVRPQVVEMDRIDASLFSRNFSAPWRKVGRIETHSGRIIWLEPPRTEERKLGDYLSRILAR